MFVIVLKSTKSNILTICFSFMTNCMIESKKLAALLIIEQQKRLEAFERTQGIGNQNYPVDQVLGPMEGKAVLLKVSLKP